MSDALVTSTNREEALSRAYVAAITAGAGYQVAKADFDFDGVDLTIQAGGLVRPRLDIQLKATINLGAPAEGVFRYPLKRRNYDLLREATMVPRILVVLDLPTNETDWLDVTPDELIMRKCAYWTSLLGARETDNKETVTISIQHANRFDVEGLKTLMQKARTGSIA
jgi:hypothetical protein